MAYITVTKHTLGRIEQITNYKGRNAEMFIINLFKKLSDRSRLGKTNKGRKVIYGYLGEERYHIGDGKHRIVFRKDRLNNEEIIITYINKEEKTWNDDMKQVMSQLGILGTTI